MTVDLDRLNTDVTDLQDALTREYPEATASPCNECPWRRTAAAGWLGPHTAERWAEIAHGEAPVACHKTIPDGGGWGPKTQQCRGLASFRTNVCKSPHNPTIATGPADKEKVFSSSAEFINYHNRTGGADE